MSARAKLKLPGRQPWKPGGGIKERKLKSDEIVGRRVRVWWRDDRCYYKGTVTGYSTKLGKHIVEYDDGDTEKVDLKTEIWRLLEKELEDENHTSKGKEEGKESGDEHSSDSDDDSEDSDDDVDEGDQEEPAIKMEERDTKDKQSDSEGELKRKRKKKLIKKKVRRKLLDSGDEKPMSEEGAKSGEAGDQAEAAGKAVPNGPERERRAKLLSDPSPPKKRESTLSHPHDTRDVLVVPSTSGADPSTNPTELLLTFANGTAQHSDRSVVMKGPGFEIHRVSSPSSYDVFCQLPRSRLDSMAVQSAQQCVIVQYVEDDVSTGSSKGREEGSGVKCRTIINMPSPIDTIRQCLLTPEGRLYLQVEKK